MDTKMTKLIQEILFWINELKLGRISNTYLIYRISRIVREEVQKICPREEEVSDDSDDNIDNYADDDATTIDNISNDAADDDDIDDIDNDAADEQIRAFLNGS